MRPVDYLTAAVILPLLVVALGFGSYHAGHLIAGTHPVQAPNPPGIVDDIDWRLGFTWDVEERNPGDKVLHVSYNDGREFLFRDKAITSVFYYPEKFGRLGNGHAFIEVHCGSRVTRLDVTDKSGEDLVELLTIPSE